MAVKITVKDYVEYLNKTSFKIKENEDYITKLDATTGDGDHCANLMLGFNSLLDQKEELLNMTFYELFKKCGMVFMSKVGGSSGILYGSAYLESAKVVKDIQEYITLNDLELILKAQLQGIMNRGDAKPGFKTMIDTLYKAHEEFKMAIGQGNTERKAIKHMKDGARLGMQATKDMEAVKGRACYRKDKGVGHLDPGAVTMYYQLETLADYLLEMED